jgi:hypothetical protein
MSCVLRIYGKKFNLDTFLSQTSLKPSAVFRKGEPRIKDNPKGKKILQNGVNIGVSYASFHDLDGQIRDAIKFLKENKKELRRIIASKEINGIWVLDFAIKRRDVAVQCEEFPQELLLLMGSLGVTLQVSYYIAVQISRTRIV